MLYICRESEIYTILRFSYIYTQNRAISSRRNLANEQTFQLTWDKVGEYFVRYTSYEVHSRQWNRIPQSSARV